MTNVDTAKQQREKSPAYPAVTLEACLEFIKDVDSLGGKSVSYSTILDKMGLSSPTTKSFINRISASKQYGFITTGASTVQLTDIAKRILYPPYEGEKEKLLVESFSNPPLYSKLIERFKNKALPAKAQLANILMNEYRILKPVKDKAAQCFIVSADYLGLIQNGVLQEDDSITSHAASASTQQHNTMGHSHLVQNDESSSPQLSNDSLDGFSFEMPTLSGKTAKAFIPVGLSKKELDYINKFFSDFIEMIKGELENNTHPSEDEL